MALGSSILLPAKSNLLEYELDGDKVSRDNFHLPTLQHVLRELSLEVHNGRGFFILRGLDLPKYSIADGTIIFLGIQSYIAEQRARQDDQGNILSMYSRSVYLISACGYGLFEIFVKVSK